MLSQVFQVLFMGINHYSLGHSYAEKLGSASEKSHFDHHHITLYRKLMFLLPCLTYTESAFWFFFSSFLCEYIFFVFLGPHPQYMEVPRLGVQLEL